MVSLTILPRDCMELIRFILWSFQFPANPSLELRMRTAQAALERVKKLIVHLQAGHPIASSRLRMPRTKTNVQGYSYRQRADVSSRFDMRDSVVMALRLLAANVRLRREPGT